MIKHRLCIFKTMMKIRAFRRHESRIIVFGLQFPQGADMPKKPTYEQLLQRIGELEEVETALKRAYAELRLIFDAAGDGMLVIDTDFNIIKVNRSFAGLCEKTAESITGRKCFDVCPGPACHTARCHLTRVLDGEEYFEDEKERVLSNGADIYCLVTTTAYRDHDGRLLGIVQNFKDITRRKQAETALRRQKDFLQNALDALTYPFYVIDVKDYKIKLANKAAHSGKYRQGITCYQLTHNRNSPCSDDKHQCTLKEVKRTGRPVVLEHLHSTGAGEKRNVEVHAYPIFDEQGELSQIIEYCLDITERRWKEEERRRLTTAIEQSAGIIIITDRDATIQYVNPSFERTTGYSKEEALGEKLSLLKSDRHDAAFYRRMWETLTSGKVWQGHIINKKKDGSLFEEEASISPVFNEEEEIVNYVAVKRDVTEQMKLEKQLRQAQKMEAIGTLAGGIAHDFNNILAAVLGYAELAKMGVATDGPVKNDLEEVLKAGNRAKELVKQILTFSRQSEQDFKPLKIQFVIKEALKLLRSSIPTTVEIKQDIDTACGAVLADPTQIHQIIMNLCTNAYHAMREKGGVLGVSLRQTAIVPDELIKKMGFKPGSYVVLEVSDTGVGMAPAVLERIFEPYFTTKKKGEGTGLGLAVVQGIVKSHGGHINVYSEPGQGAAFRVYLPLADTKKISNSGKTSAAEAIKGGSERLLIVDDDEKIVVLEEKILTSLGYQVTAFTSSEEALQHFKKQPAAFQAILTDMTMPKMTGKELARQILAVRPDIPVILCTGFSELINEEEAQAIGIREFIMKPFQTQELADVMRKALD